MSFLSTLLNVPILMLSACHHPLSHHFPIQFTRFSQQTYSSVICIFLLYHFFCHIELVLGRNNGLIYSHPISSSHVWFPQTKAFHPQANPRNQSVVLSDFFIFLGSSYWLHLSPSPVCSIPCMTHSFVYSSLEHLKQLSLHPSVSSLVRGET